MKTLDTRCVVESVFLLGQVGECGELPVKRSVLKLFPSATVHMTLAEAAGKLRSLCASGFLKFLGVPLRKHVESVTQWVELVVSGRAPKLPNTTGRIFLGKVDQSFLLLHASGCRLQADKPSRGAHDWSGRIDQVVLRCRLETDLVSL